MRNELSLIFHNQILLTGAAAWGISQILKLIIYRIVNTLGDVIAFLFCVFRDVLQKKAVKAG